MAIAAVTLAISVYGHATIVKLYLPFTAVFTVLAGDVLTRARGPGPRTRCTARYCGPLAAPWPCVGPPAPLSYNNSADFSRYLPRATRPTSVAGWTALGTVVPSVAFTALGALAGTALDMTDPQVRARRDPARLVPARVPAGRRPGHDRQQRPDRLQIGPGPAGGWRPHPPGPAASPWTAPSAWP